MKPDNFISKAAKSILLILCLAVSASQADAEVKIESVSQTVGVMGKNMEVTLTGQGLELDISSDFGYVFQVSEFSKKGR